MSELHSFLQLAFTDFSQRPPVSERALLALQSLSTPSVRSVAAEAGFGSFVVDGSILLLPSPAYRGWSSIDFTLAKDDRDLPSELLSIYQDRIAKISRGKYRNETVLEVISFYEPSSAQLSMSVRPVKWFDFFAIAGVAHETGLLRSEPNRSIAAKYCVQSIQRLTNPDDRPALPNLINIQVILATSDDRLLLMQRSQTVAFQQGRWSASFEETMNVTDATFSDAALRGVAEECGDSARANCETVHILSLNYEFSSLAVTPVAFLRTALSAAALQESWWTAHDQAEAASVRFIKFDPLSIGREIFGGLYFHPSSRKRLLEAAFFEFGVGPTLSALAVAYHERPGR